jgi:ACR3 family arsenite efflux pump ArsB
VYVFLEPFAGLVAAVIYLALLAHAQQFYVASAQAISIALAVHVFSWLAQVAVGHALLEKRRPALMTSLFSSLILAPFFVVIEARIRATDSSALLATLTCSTRTGHVCRRLPPCSARGAARACLAGGRRLACGAAEAAVKAWGRRETPSAPQPEQRHRDNDADSACTTRQRTTRAASKAPI